MSSVVADLANRHGAALARLRRRVTVCSGSSCRSAGADAVRNALAWAFTERGVPAVVSLGELPPQGAVHLGVSACQGLCQRGPLVQLMPDGLVYERVKPEDAAGIADAVLAGEVVERLLPRDGSGGACRHRREIPFYAAQDRFVLDVSTGLDPDDLPAYCHAGGYVQAQRAWREFDAAQLCRLISDSGLRGRGGGGFPTGRKLDLCRQQRGERTIVVANSDARHPHVIIEGLAIAARAVGAAEGWIYVRAVHVGAAERLRAAIAAAEAAGLIGPNAFGSGRPLRLEVMSGGSSFVCGEESALLNVIAGQRGMPDPRFPYPVERGLYGCPTTVLNAETLATLRRVLECGPDALRARGTSGSPGTKIFLLTGDVVNTGMAEVPFGTTLRHLVFTIGGGVLKDGQVGDEDAFLAAQVGGPLGGFLGREHLDLPLDYDTVRSVGGDLGNGGVVVIARGACLVDTTRLAVAFAAAESCGKCVPCRLGTRSMLVQLDDLVNGRADATTVARLEELARMARDASLCGLGRMSALPVLTALALWRDEFDAHAEGVCPAMRCKALCPPVIDAERCKGCGVCLRACPVNAISGEKRQAHHINPDLCIRCGACRTACKPGAIA